jgi:hypothetical protein
MTETSSNILDNEAVRTLARLVEEATRSTREGAKRFVEPAEGTLERAKSRRHHIIFGRRGSGKSTLLTKAASELTVDRRPIVLVDLEEFKGHTYPDVLISVLIRTLGQFEEWLKTAAINPATKTSFWNKLFGTSPTRPALKRTEVSDLVAGIGELLKELNGLLYEPDSADHLVKQEASMARHTGFSGGLSGGSTVKANLSAKMNNDNSVKRTVESKYSHEKIAVLQKNIIKYKDLFGRLAKISDGASFLLLDDLYHIPRRDQAHLIDYLGFIPLTNSFH